jgi:glycosyltransferase involved in cell wall biosynthesis
MRIVQAVAGVFHHFELARELEQRHLLEHIYSTFPRIRLKREDLPRERVSTFPYLHTPQMLAWRYRVNNVHLHRYWNRLNLGSFDRWVQLQTARRPAPDVLISLSGSVLHAARALQRRGSLFICDRGSTHQLIQEQIVAEEYRIWGLQPPQIDPATTRRELESYDSADAITIPSQSSLRSFLQAGVPAHKLHVIPYGVKLDQFHPVDTPPAYHRDGIFEVLFVGGVNLRKGIPYLLKAFAQLQHPRKRLTLIGAVDPAIEALLPTLPTQDVHILGSLPQSQLPGYMSRSHILVLPSIEDGFGLVMPQAMACRCPILASVNTGGQDLFTNGVEGFHVPIRSPEAIADRLQQLADDPALQDRMAAAALNRVQALGGWHQYGDQWEALLRTLTGTAQPPAPLASSLATPVNQS